MRNTLEIKNFFLDLQASICNELEQEDGQAKFLADPWENPALGYGTSRLITNGKVIEKGGVNFSNVFGTALPSSATAKRPELAGYSYEAAGVSIVIHPVNPFVPTSHANFRLFIARRKKAKPVWWFGGGFDLTPYYGFVEDCVHWHTMAKSACDPFGTDLYPRYKKWCDEYFYLPHRNEPRGIGGIFFDDLNDGDLSKCFAFVKSAAQQYIKAYRPIVNKRKNMPYSARQKSFQLYRRGRYVEFNLLYDRGTVFGLRSGGRVNSILMSLPPQVEWPYEWQLEPGSDEDRLYSEFLINKDWVQ